MSRVEMCSSMDICYSFYQAKFDNKKCEKNESCAKMYTNERIYNGCILNKYCELKQGKVKGELVQIECPEKRIETINSLTKEEANSKIITTSEIIHDKNKI